MSRFQCRCRHCRTRRVLPVHPEKYKVVPQCRVCGKRTYTIRGVRAPIFFVDKWMTERTAKNRALGCMCCGYAWAGMMTGAMHRRGSRKCWYRADGSKREYGDADYYVDPEYHEPERLTA